MSVPPAFSEEDFQRIQENLLQFKTENYSLSDQCRKHKQAFENAQGRISILERDLEKAQRIVQKSKKAMEVSMLVQDNENLQKQLRAQEEDFRHQNQTLLTELSNLVTINEKLEQEIKNSHPNDGDSNANERRRPITEELISLRAENGVLKEELVSFKKQLEKSTEEREKLKSNLESHCGDAKSTEIVHVSSASVSFSRQVSALDETDESSSQGYINSEEKNQLEDDLNRTKSILIRCQEQNAKLVQDLESKQSQVTQLQKELQQQAAIFNDKITELQFMDPDAARKMSEEISSLKSQLQKGYVSFNDYKEKKSVEMANIRKELEVSNEKLESTTKKLSELEANFQDCQSELIETKTSYETLDKEKENLFNERKRLEDLLHDKEEELQNVNKKSNERKALLDEMAETIRNRTDESRVAIEELEEKLKGLESSYEAAQEKVFEADNEIHRLQELSNKFQNEVIELREKIGKLESEIEYLQTNHAKEKKDLKESHENKKNELEKEKDKAVKDLEMQLEIANAQKTEFEESVYILKQEVKDLQEDKKIVTKKNSGILKDLKRQLLAEKQRNEKLQDKLKDCFTDISPLVSDPSREVEADRTSISSWSLMSGQNERDPNSRSTPVPLSGEQNTIPRSYSVSPEELSSPVSIDVDANSDHSLLLSKISSLQDQRLVYEEKIQMLENSSAAMADELLRKNALIQYYCMEGGKASTNSTSSNSTDKTLMMKKIMNMLVHPDVETRKQIQKMQNLVEETLTKNMHLQRDLEKLSQEVVRLSKAVPNSNGN